MLECSEVNQNNIGFKFVEKVPEYAVLQCSPSLSLQSEFPPFYWETSYQKEALLGVTTRREAALKKTEWFGAFRQPCGWDGGQNSTEWFRGSSKDKWMVWGSFQGDLDVWRKLKMKLGDLEETLRSIGVLKEAIKATVWFGGSSKGNLIVGALKENWWL